MHRNGKPRRIPIYKLLGGGCKHSSGVFHNANAALIRTRPDLLCGDGRHAHKRALPL